MKPIPNLVTANHRAMDQALAGWKRDALHAQAIEMDECLDLMADISFDVAERLDAEDRYIEAVDVDPLHEREVPLD